MTQGNRRELLLGGAALPFLAGLASAQSADQNTGQDAPQKAELAFTGDEDLNWHDPLDWGMEGQGWSAELAAPFDRLPARAEAKVRPALWGLSRHSAGLCANFESDSPVVAVRYVLRSGSLAMPHMPATGVSGCCLYAREPGGVWRWVRTSRPAGRLVRLRVDGLRPGLREQRVYLPLYNGVLRMQVGVLPGFKFQGTAPRASKPIVMYGTSILHGACASRPGMAFPSILGRRLDRPVMNLGFSGQGKMDAALGDLLAELDPAVFVVDCLPNMGAEAVATHSAPLARQLRAARPDTPILFTEGRTFATAYWQPDRYVSAEAKRSALGRALATLRDEGLGGLHLLAGANLLGGDGEATVDGSHPTDLGMVRYADAYEGVLRALLLPA